MILISNAHEQRILFMDAIREIVSGNALASVIKLPKRLRDRQVEVIVLPAHDSDAANAADATPKVSRAELDEMKKTSSAVELTGSIPYPYMTIRP
jgi:hypothetical protein